jgi:hypothetical protein
MISTFRPELIGASSLGAFEITSWTYGRGGRVKEDDVLADPSLQTHFDSVTGEVFRRIKHFSGISLSSGATGDYGSSEY